MDSGSSSDLSNQVQPDATDSSSCLDVEPTTRYFTDAPSDSYYFPESAAGNNTNNTIQPLNSSQVDGPVGGQENNTLLADLMARLPAQQNVGDQDSNVEKPQSLMASGQSLKSKRAKRNRRVADYLPSSTDSDLDAQPRNHSSLKKPKPGPDMAKFSSSPASSTPSSRPLSQALLSSGMLATYWCKMVEQ